MSVKVVGPGTGIAKWEAFAVGGSPPERDAPAALDPSTVEQHHREVEAAFQLGLQQGREEGRRHSEQAVNRELGRLTAAIERVTALQPRLRKEAERDVVELALAVARRILRRELHMDPGALLGVVKAGIEVLGHRDTVRLVVSPDMEGMMRQAAQGLGGTKCEIDVDAALDEGSILLQGGNSWLEASVDSQLDEIRRGFADRMGWKG